jgi:aldehyde dehydrogenase (NAD+)
MEAFKNFIDGKWVESKSGKTFERRNPADTRELIGVFQSSSEEDVSMALESAKNAQRAWGGTPAPKRGEILYKCADILSSRAGEIAKILTMEEGKTLGESTGEVKRAIDIFRFFAGAGHLLKGKTLPADTPATMLYTMRVPVGVVAIITPWNFPIAIPAWKIAPALICGNTIVFKPASYTPLTGLKLVQCLAEAGLPPGVLNYVTGSGKIIGEKLATSEEINAISFTGSYEVGEIIYQKTGKRMVRTQLEMGGKNPLIVLKDADLDKAVELTVKGAFGLTGQACTATSRVIVEEPVIRPFTEKLLTRAKKIRIGNGLEKGTDMGPAVSESEIEKDLSYISIGKKERAKLLMEGGRLEGEEWKHGYFISPTIFTEVEPRMRIAREEIFGPVLSVMPAKDFDDAIELANAIEYGLTASICTSNLHLAHEFANRISAGVIKVNQPTTGLSLHVPFGGIKKSSSGTFKEQGEEALDFFTFLKTVYLDYGR